jgi:hypothetical protein
VGAQPGGEINGRSPPCRTRSGEPRYGVGPASDRVRLLSASISATSRSPSAGPAAESGQMPARVGWTRRSSSGKSSIRTGPSRRSSRRSASRLHPALERGIARRAERWPQFEKPPPSTPGDLVFSACGRRGSHFSVAASLVGGSPLQRQCWLAIGATLQVIVVLYRS